MRLGFVISAGTIEGLCEEALAAERSGIEIAWLAAEADADTALIRAAAVAARTHTIRLAACVVVGGHPLEIAEAAAVADNCSNGRLILVLEDRTHDSELVAETLDVVLVATAPRPFRHQGRRWTIPANLPENDQHEEQIIVTPQVVQPQLPIWLAGSSAGPVAKARGLVHVMCEGDELEQARHSWADAQSSVKPVAIGAPRPMLLPLETDGDGAFDEDAVVARLRAGHGTWGLDTAVLEAPEALQPDARSAAIAQIARRVRPRVMLHELPNGLERHWKEVLV